MRRVRQVLLPGRQPQPPQADDAQRRATAQADTRRAHLQTADRRRRRDHGNRTRWRACRGYPQTSSVCMRYTGFPKKKDTSYLDFKKS